MQLAYVGIDVAFAKRKRLPVVFCFWNGDRLIPAPLRHLSLRPPVGQGNLRSCDAATVAQFARDTADYLRAVEAHLDCRIARIGIDAPSRARIAGASRRDAEAALDKAGIRCFTTPSEQDFVRIRAKVAEHVRSGGVESRLPHANQLWMQVGFALFSELTDIAECVEVYPQATIRKLGLTGQHKSQAAGLEEQLGAAARITGWPRGMPGEPSLGEIAWAPRHDQLDAYLSAWVAALDESQRESFGTAPDDVIWVPRVAAADTTIALSRPLDPRKIGEAFAREFEPWNISLDPSSVSQRLAGERRKAGWVLRYVFGRTARGEYLEFYATPRTV